MDQDLLLTFMMIFQTLLTIIGLYCVASIVILNERIANMRKQLADLEDKNMKKPKHMKLNEEYEPKRKPEYRPGPEYIK